MKTEISESPPVPTTSPRPKKRWLRRGAIILVSLASLTALFYAVENWRGARVWAATLDDLKARGAKMSLEDFKETPIPDDQNMVMHPAFRCFTFTRPDGTRARRLEHDLPLVSVIRPKDAPIPPPPESDKPDPQDAAMAAKWETLVNLRAQNDSDFSELYDLWDAPKPDPEALRKTLEKLKPLLAGQEELLAAVRDACRRPGCQWPSRAGSGDKKAEIMAPLNSMNIFKPLMECSHLLAVDSFLHASEGRTQEAWADLECFGQLSLCGRKVNPTMMASLFSAAVEGLEASTTGRLLENTSAASEKYGAFEMSLSDRPPLIDSLITAEEGERAWTITLLQWTFQDGNEVRALAGLSEDFGKLPAISLIPRGWYRQNAAATLKLDSGMLDALHSSGPPGVRVKALKNFLTASSAASKYSPYQYLARGKAMVYAGIGEGILRTDGMRALVRTALLCAQQRAATGKTPMSLDDLSPELKARVPRSPIQGDPPVITRAEDGLWTLSYKPLGDQPVPDDLSLKLRGW